MKRRQFAEGLLSRQSVLRMAFVVAHEHHTETFGANLIKHMVGKAIEVGPSKTLIREVKTEWAF